MTKQTVRAERPMPTAGMIITETARIACPHCGACYADASGSEILTNTAESYHALTRTLVCRGCAVRFVKPRIPGWSRHPSGVTFDTRGRAVPDHGTGSTRPGAAQTPTTGHTGEWISPAASEAARAFGEAVRSLPFRFWLD